MDLDFTMEQNDSRAARSAIFCSASAARLNSVSARPTATRDPLAEIYSKLADLGWLGVTIDQDLAARAGDGRRLHLHGGVLRGLAPSVANATTDRCLGRPELRHRRAEAQDPRRHRLRLGRGDRDDLSPRPAPTSASAHHLSRTSYRRLRPQRPEGLLLNAHIDDVDRLPHHQGRRAATRASPHALSRADNPGTVAELIDTLGGRETNDVYLTDGEVGERTPCRARPTTVTWTQLMAGC